MEKKYPITGADEATPSVPYYFSWINNTNEGSTERQTLINLDFFAYLKRKYGMQIKIYAWDAGNFDGASEGYGSLESEKFKSQYPDEYKNCAARAKELGIRLGLWGSPDGFGDTPEEEKERFDFYVHLCRDYNFAAFKLDGVCGFLRPEKAHVYAEMVRECRKYSPDLLLVNHRLNFFEAQKYITTFLWNGDETYTDVHSFNRRTAMHNREYFLERGNVVVDGKLVRLAEDHGVCLSSSLDYFEDELIYQAFGRCLIMAPEIYGNPWLLKDSEYAKLARVYNLHARHSDILVSGKELPAEYGCFAVTRGDGTHRFICTGNNGWCGKKITLTLDDSIGLEKCGKVAVNMRNPHEENIGVFEYGDRVEIELAPFRATLIEVAELSRADSVLLGCKYLMEREGENGEPVSVRYLEAESDEIYMLSGGEKKYFGRCDMMLGAENTPVKLASAVGEEPEISCEKLYESAMFAINNDSLEACCLARAGETEIPEVKAARDAFFEQKTYLLRGCEAKYMFDGNDDTFFDGQSRRYNEFVLRQKGGCLRVDLGEKVSADRIELVYFEAERETPELPLQLDANILEYSTDLENWKSVTDAENSDVCKYSTEVVKFTEHTLYNIDGKKVSLVFNIGDDVRYIRIPSAPYRIYSFKVFADGREVKLSDPFANNLMPHYSVSPVKKVKTCVVTLPKFKDGAYLAAAIEGVHGEEGVFAVCEIDGELYGFEGRAPHYKSNVWEHLVCSSDSFNTLFKKLPADAAGKTAKIYVMFLDGEKTDARCDVYLCDRHI